ncbi:ABC transporter substrate-binding protein [Bifidobacterium saguinibicoloris]|uniref:ABC transporter substrate-binding protein n=1 Tax=Bifidobacterium saguinibicoloris TaxID=2834433 RepID=UPI001C571FA7|nr:sugar ABC transporter substrate-binding protein [Bifidobacterium saguinibicoloris]MBW3081625.1 sugar ABC transporter substrate-binding protein [Bifidobacterium saguinibicoloris]
MKFSMKKTVALVGAAAMIASMAACGSSTASNGDANGDVTLNLWAWEPTLKPVIKAFEKKYPNIKVDFNNTGKADTTVTSLNNAIQAGSGIPDVVQIEYMSIPQYVIGQENLLNIKDRTSGYDKFYTPGTWSSVNVGDGVYALPMDSGPQAMFYNKATFDKAGITEAPKTWDEYYQDAKKIRALGDSYYITADTGDIKVMTAFLWQAGAQPYKTDGENVTINFKSDPEVKTVAEFWQKMIDEDLINTKVATWADEWNRGIADGTIASIFEGAWMPANLVSNSAGAKGNMRVALQPNWDASKPNNGENGGSALAITKASKNADAAFKFIDFVNHDKEGIKIRTDGGAFPADQESLKSDEFLKGSQEITDYFGGQEYNKVLAEAASQVTNSFDFLPFSGQANTTYGDYVGKAYTDKSTTLMKGLAAFQDSLVKYGKDQGFTVKEG